MQTVNHWLITLLPSLIARRWVGRQTQWWPRHKATYLSWLGPELCCPLLGPPGFNCWFSFAPEFQWCCSTPQGSPGVGRNTFLSSSLFHHSIYLWFICFPWWSIDELENLHADRTTVCFKPWQKPRARLGIRKTGLSPPPSILILTVPRRYSCCGSLLLLVLAVRIYTLVQLLC